MPPVFHLACAAHMDNVNDFKVADFSGRLIDEVCIAIKWYKSMRGLNKQILLDIQNKTYFKLKYIAHTDPQ